MGDVIDRDGFRANVGIILMQGDGRLFIGRRSGGRGWQFPQGGMQRGEKAEDSLFRELNEEIGLERDDVEIIGQTRGWLRYRLPRALPAARFAAAVHRPEAALVPAAAASAPDPRISLRPTGAP